MSQNAGTNRTDVRSAKIIKLRRRRHRIFRSIIAAMAAAVVLVVLALVFCRVNNFTVSGSAPYTKDEIVTAIQLTKGKSMFFLNTDDIKDSIEVSLPYADKVKVTKKFPRTVVINAEKANETYAVMLSEKLYAITNESLKVLKAAAVVSKGVTVIKSKSIATYEVGKPISFTGQPGDDPIKATLLSIAQAIEESKLKDINLISVENETGIYFVYDKRIIIKLGNNENLADKISLGKKTLDEENKLSAFQYGELDLTISKEAVFAPDDMKDLPELTEYLELEQELSTSGSTTSDEKDENTGTSEDGENDNSETSAADNSAQTLTEETSTENYTVV